MRLEHHLNLNGYDDHYWAFHADDFSIDIVPTVLFARACDNNKWSRSTKRIYSHIVEFFFRALRLHGANFRSLSNSELKGFMQGYYLRKMPWQIEGHPVSLERMKIVELVLKEIIMAGVQLGFCNSRTSSFYFKRVEAADSKLDEAEEIYTNYISKKLFSKFIAEIPTKRPFENARDTLALKIAYGCGLRSEELVRADNFSPKRLKSARLNYRLGEPIEWRIVGKGRDGGKSRQILIKPALAINIFDFTDQYIAPNEEGRSIFRQKNGKLLSPKYLTNLFAVIRDRIGDSQLNHLSAHSLRHSFATNLANECFERNMNLRIVQERLGHSNSGTTKVYIEVAHLISGREPGAEWKNTEGKRYD